MANEVHINVDPESSHAHLRHLCRIDRLRQSIAKPRMQEHRDSLQKEINRRTDTLKHAGIIVPKDDIGLRDLIAKTYDSMRKEEAK